MQVHIWRIQKEKQTNKPTKIWVEYQTQHSTDLLQIVYPWKVKKKRLTLNTRDNVKVQNCSDRLLQNVLTVYNGNITIFMKCCKVWEHDEDSKKINRQHKKFVRDCNVCSSVHVDYHTITILEKFNFSSPISVFCCEIWSTSIICPEITTFHRGQKYANCQKFRGSFLVIHLFAFNLSLYLGIFHSLTKEKAVKQSC